MSDYQYETRNVAAFVSQVVRYVAAGHYFYVRVLIPEGKDAAAVDAKLLARYDVKKKRWQRKRRYLKRTASIHYLRCNRCAVLMLTKGNHEQFYQDHASSVRDIRRQALKVFGYSIRYGVSTTTKNPKILVRLDQQKCREVRAHFMTICTWNSFRDPRRLEREFARLPYQPYGPVFLQLHSIWKAANRSRRRRGFEPLAFACLRNKLSLRKVFVAREEDLLQPAAVTSEGAKSSV